MLILGTVNSGEDSKERVFGRLCRYEGGYLEWQYEESERVASGTYACMQRVISIR